MLTVLHAFITLCAAFITLQLNNLNELENIEQLLYREHKGELFQLIPTTE